MRRAVWSDDATMRNDDSSCTKYNEKQRGVEHQKVFQVYKPGTHEFRRPCCKT